MRAAFCQRLDEVKRRRISPYRRSPRRRARAGWVLAPARSRATIAASCRLRSSSGPNFGARSAGSGISSSGARSVAVSPGRRGRFTWASVRLEVGEPRCSAATSWPPKREPRPHSATGCRGVLLQSSWDEFHSTQVCGVSNASREWNSSMRAATCRAPARQRSGQTGRSRRRGRGPSDGVEQRPNVLLAADERR